MPTTTVKTIGSGRDYSTLQAWEDATPANLVTNDEIWQGQVYKEGGGTDGEWVLTTALSFAGTTADVTRYVELIPASGQGMSSSNALRYNPAFGVAIAQTGAYEHAITVAANQWVRLIGLQVNNRQAGSNRFCIAGSGNSNIYVDKCVFKQDVAGVGVLFASPNAAQDPFRRIANSLIHVTSATGIAFRDDGNAGVQVRNVTAYGNGGANAFVASYGSTAVVLNCAAFGFTAFTSTGGGGGIFNVASSGNNATNLSTAYGSTGTNRTSLTASDQFTSLTSGSEDFRVKTGATLISNASVDSTYAANDVFGSARSGTAPTIGAHEAAGASGFSLTADSGTFTYTGQSNNFLYGRVVGGGQGTFTVTGADSSSLVGYNLIADQGTYSLTGQDATLTYTPTGGYSLTAEVGLYTYSGQDAALVKVGQYSLTSDSGTFSYTGQAANFGRTYILTSDAGSYTVSFQAANLIAPSRFNLGGGRKKLLGGLGLW